MGCMLMRECEDGVAEIKTVADMERFLAFSNYNEVRTEADAIIAELNKMGVSVYLADGKYWPRGHAGAYYTVGNNFFLNAKWVDDPVSFLQTLRHEGWHACQDYMAGTIDNSMMAVIMDDKLIPQEFKLLAEISYPEHVRPWEQEAKWAGETPNMTLNMLREMNSSNGRPWEVIEPTPLTRLWLERNGYM